jgi:prepilin-type N-terminal cleavage/methylation domain-containing protein
MTSWSGWRQSATMAQRGFTLVELMVTLVILALAGTFIYTVFISQHDSYVTQQDVSESQQDVRVSLDMLTRDLQSTGFGVSGGGNGITTATNSSITFGVAQSFQVASGASPFLTADPAGALITVNTVAPFAVGDTIRILSMFDRNQIGSYSINAIDTGASQLTLNGTPVNGHQGDLMVGDLNTITYNLNGDILQRAVTVIVGGLPTTTTEQLADQIQSLQFSYTLADGTVTSAPTAANLPNIRMVRVTLTSHTVHDVAKFGGADRIRSLSTEVKIKNGVDNRVS